MLHQMNCYATMEENLMTKFYIISKLNNTVERYNIKLLKTARTLMPASDQITKGFELKG